MIWSIDISFQQIDCQYLQNFCCQEIVGKMLDNLQLYHLDLRGWTLLLICWHPKTAQVGSADVVVDDDDEVVDELVWLDTDVEILVEDKLEELAIDIDETLLLEDDEDKGWELVVADYVSHPGVSHGQTVRVRMTVTVTSVLPA